MNQILTKNPGWGYAPGSTDGLRHDYTMQACGSDSTIATGDSINISKLITLFRHPKGRWTIGPGRCHRFGCDENAGFYWCNVSPPKAKAQPSCERQTC